MPFVRAAKSIACLAALALAVGGCGDSSKSEPTAESPASAPVRDMDFPQGAGKTLVALREGLAEGPILAAGTSLLDVGRNRFAFALFDNARKQLTGAEVAVYVSDRSGNSVEGPFLARNESLEVKNQFLSETTAQDADTARSVYVADLPFRRKGQGLVMGLARLDGRLVATTVAQVGVGQRRGPPDVGDKAIRVKTPTVASAKGKLSKIDTRVPPAPDLHRHDLADVLGKRPVVLTFATPRLCESRLCGPVVDVVKEVKGSIGDRAAFIHVEVYNDNDPAKGYRRQLLAWRLPTEPWTFVIDRSGIVRTRFEGAVSVTELRRAVRKVV